MFQEFVALSPSMIDKYGRQNADVIHVKELEDYSKT